MKKILLILVLTIAVNSLIQAQTKSKVESKSLKTNTLKLTPVNVTKSSTREPQTTPTQTTPTQTTPPETTPPMPDLRITTLSISTISSSTEGVGSTKYKFQVSYTIANEGNIAVDASSVFVSGTIVSEPTNYNYMGGCGTVISTLAGTMINPGQIYLGSFLCTQFFGTPQYIYILNVDPYNLVSELNEQNNSAQISILFN